MLWDRTQISQVECGSARHRLPTRPLGVSNVRLVVYGAYGSVLGKGTSVRLGTTTHVPSGPSEMEAAATLNRGVSNGFTGDGPIIRKHA